MNLSGGTVSPIGRAFLKGTGFSPYISSRNRI
jgi:hypothetical protein